MGRSRRERERPGVHLDRHRAGARIPVIAGPYDRRVGHALATGVCVALITSSAAAAAASRSAPERVATAGTRSAIAALRPAIHQWPIPFGSTRRREMAAYSLRHYGEDSYVLRQPKVIVEHFTQTATAGAAYDTFAPDVPDAELHELPNTCAHFLVERDGRIDQLVPLTLRCRHTVGLNWTAIGIENVGFSDREILADRRQMRASLALTRWLRCTYAITLTNVIGHNESLSSAYHRERVASLQHQTHSDWNSTDMHVYRTELARLRCPAGSFGRIARAAIQHDPGGI
jgi:N-acetylmuramoyl-L-alanine amidase